MANGNSAPRISRDERGETIALLVLWPAMLTAVLLLVVQAFIVSNARAQAELAASEGLRAARQVAAVSDFYTVRYSDQFSFDCDPGRPEALRPQCWVPWDASNGIHPEVPAMVNAAQDAVAHAAAGSGGWRWYSPNVAEVYSNWCADGEQTDSAGELFQQPVVQPADSRELGWTRVVVSGEIIGPMAAIFPGLLDQVYAVASGPAAPTDARGVALGSDPVELPVC